MIQKLKIMIENEPINLDINLQVNVYCFRLHMLNILYSIQLSSIIFSSFDAYPILQNCNKKTFYLHHVHFGCHYSHIKFALKFTKIN